jgi:hypothetical protein
MTYKQYTADDGEAFALEQVRPYRILYRGGGTQRMFFQIERLGLSSTGQVATHTFTSPLQDITDGSFTVTPHTLTYSGRTFMLTDVADAAVGTPILLPVVPRCEYFFLAHETSPYTYIYVSSDVYNYTLDFRVWVGDGTTMEKLTIERYPIRWKDGGTTYIDTEEGILIVPTMLNTHGTPPTFASQAVTPLAVGDYTIVDEEQAVTIGRKVGIGLHSLRSHTSS